MKDLKKELLPERLQSLKVGDRVVIRSKEELSAVGVQDTNILLYLSRSSFIMGKHNMEEIAKGAYKNGAKIAQFIIGESTVKMAKKNGAPKEFIEQLDWNSLIDITIDYIEIEKE